MVVLLVNSDLKSTLGEAFVTWVQAPTRPLHVETWENHDNKKEHKGTRSLGRELNPRYPGYEGETRLLLLTY